MLARLLGGPYDGLYLNVNENLYNIDFPIIGNLKMQNDYETAFLVNRYVRNTKHLQVYNYKGVS